MIQITSPKNECETLLDTIEEKTLISACQYVVSRIGIHTDCTIAEFFQYVKCHDVEKDALLTSLKNRQILAVLGDRIYIKPMFQWDLYPGVLANLFLKTPVDAAVIRHFINFIKPIEPEAAGMAATQFCRRAHTQRVAALQAMKGAHETERNVVAFHLSILSGSPNIFHQNMAERFSVQYKMLLQPCKSAVNKRYINAATKLTSVIQHGCVDSARSLSVELISLLGATLHTSDSAAKNSIYE